MHQAGKVRGSHESQTQQDRQITVLQIVEQLDCANVHIHVLSPAFDFDAIFSANVK